MFKGDLAKVKVPVHQGVTQAVGQGLCPDSLANMKADPFLKVTILAVVISDVLECISYFENGMRLFLL